MGLVEWCCALRVPPSFLLPACVSSLPECRRRHFNLLSHPTLTLEPDPASMRLSAPPQIDELPKLPPALREHASIASHDFPQGAWLPGRSALKLSQAFAPQLFSQPPPRLPGAVDYTYIKLLLHQLFSQPPRLPGAVDYTYIKLLLTNSLTAAQGFPGAVDYTYIKLLAPTRPNIF
ncbi:hypothetical protein B0H14DRAFT_2617808 [Mycena olivaceomarginata]|nr:hypothetical protein B0H14DRAFT_2617808 [Mycena olivaceomarginata]